MYNDICYFDRLLWGVVLRLFGDKTYIVCTVNNVCLCLIKVTSVSVENTTVTVDGVNQSGETNSK